MTSIVKDGQICFNIRDLLNDDEAILRELVKTAIFDEYFIVGITQILVDGKIEWNDEEDEDEAPWYVSVYRKGAQFEEARRAVARLANPVAQKLIADLTKERDALHSRIEKQEINIHRLEEDIRLIKLHQRSTRRARNS